MAFHEYPYTDFHEMNLDWVIKKVKELATAWAQVQQDWTDEQAAFANLQSWIENYFNNLNVQTEINVKLDAMVEAGTMSELIAPFVASGLPAVVADQIGAVVASQIGPVVASQIGAVVANQLPAVAAAAAASEVSDWLAAHVNPETGYVIDDSFTVQGAAADAKAVGDEFTAIKSALTDAQLVNLLQYDLKSASVTADSDTLATVDYGLYFTEETTYIKTIKPYFSGTGEATWTLYEGNGVITDNLPLTVVKSGTFNCGDTVFVNAYMGTNRILVIHGNADSALRYYNHNLQNDFHIASIRNSAVWQAISLYNSRFACDVEMWRASYNHEIPFSTNYIYGKKIMAIGDSMVYGHNIGTSKTWLAKLANRNNMTAVNKGTNGAYMSNHQYGGVDNSVYQKVCVNTSALYITDADLTNVNFIIVYAGTNDIAQNVTIGELTSTDPTEFCGAVNAICSTLQTRKPTAKIAFITPYIRAGSISTRCKDFISALKNVCAKYDIPVFDNSVNGGINWTNSAIVSALTLNDTYHLNEDGMEYVSYKYEQFVRGL